MIYLDNAATSFPKPATVYEAMRRALDRLGFGEGALGFRCQGTVRHSCKLSGCSPFRRGNAEVKEAVAMSS